MKYCNFTIMTLNENSQLILKFFFVFIETSISFSSSTTEHYGWNHMQYFHYVTSDLAYFYAVIKDSNIWYLVQSKMDTGNVIVDHVKLNPTFVCVNKMPFTFFHISLNSLAPNCINYVPFDKVTETAEFALLKTSVTGRLCGTAIVEMS